LIAAVDEIYIRAKRSSATTYANVSTLGLLQHLFTMYGGISDSTLNENVSTLHAEYDKSLPIESLWDRVQKTTELDEDGNRPYTNQQVLTIVHSIIKNAGLKEAC